MHSRTWVPLATIELTRGAQSAIFDNFAQNSWGIRRYYIVCLILSGFMMSHTNNLQGKRLKVCAFVHPGFRPPSLPAPWRPPLPDRGGDPGSPSAATTRPRPRQVCLAPLRPGSGQPLIPSAVEKFSVDFPRGTPVPMFLCVPIAEIL